MRAAVVNKTKDGLHEMVIIRFVDNPRVIATQISVNKRLKTSKKFGAPFASAQIGIFWTIETDTEILERVKAEYWDVDDVRIEKN
jgi:hypothetical protein